MNIKTVTVVGANGIMGANVSAIFASFGNAKVYMISRQINESKRAVLKAVKAVRAEAILTNLVPADYSMLDECVSCSDLVFESVIEDIEIKMEITKRIVANLREDAIICSGTSGLSITALAECLPENLKGQYFGVHMFNPPYNMTLCEVIATKYADCRIKEALKNYLTNILFRTVIETKDTPAFLANRIGFQFINEAMQYAEKFKDNGGIDYIDTILGGFTGRVMAPLATADFVGLDVHKAIVDNVYCNSEDYARHTFILPIYVQSLIDNGNLGRKVGAGFYKMELYAGEHKRLMVYDIKTGEYREKNNYIFPFAQDMKRYIEVGDYSQAFSTLIANESQEARICLHFLLSYIVYSLTITECVAYDFQAADAAMATGFNWCPPLAMLDVLSTVTDVKSLIKEQLDEGILKRVNIDLLMQRITKSEYDYRVFIKSSK